MTYPSWHTANRQYLMDAVNYVRQRLEHQVARITSQESSIPLEDSSPTELETLFNDLDTPSVLETLSHRFGLSQFEYQILLLCAGAELSQAIGPLCAALHGNPQQAYPTLGLALALFPEPEWGALTPDAPLRRWRMIEILPGAELTRSPLRIDEQVLHTLMGIPGLDARLQGLVKFASAEFSPILPESHQALVEQIVATGLGSEPVIQLCGGDSATKVAIATATAAQLGLSLHTITADALPIDQNQINLLQCIWERESILANSLLLLDCDHLATNGDEAQRLAPIIRLIENSIRPIMVSSWERIPQRHRPFLIIDVSSPTPAEQRQLWYTHLGESDQQLNGHVSQLVTYFNLSAQSIQTVCNQVNRDPSKLKSQIWQACLTQARPKLGELAQRMQSRATWENLVLSEPEFQVLKTIAAHVRQRATVYEKWGFSNRGQRGLGISALFAGRSGTGKTLAAETLANELQLDLYRIDLSTVVSKYIGETEKNLRRIFDAAEIGGAILLFDEADALFGKRSDVKDARDRYANMEVAYLLQRIEAYRGLAILTTNLKDSLDQAFLRRIRFVVQFPFPDTAQREKIWQRSFPKETPLGEINFKTLAKLNIAGGNIRNIILNAAFLAADEGESVEMKHIIKAAQGEYIKLERPLTELRERDLKPWLTAIS